MDCVETLMELVEFRLWPLATFRQDAEYGRHLAIADTARFAAGFDPVANDAVDGAHSAASECQRVVALKRTTMRGAVHGRS